MLAIGEARYGRQAGYGGFDILGVFLTFYKAESFRMNWKESYFSLAYGI
jgi:hypothetical protein